MEKAGWLGNISNGKKCNKVKEFTQNINIGSAI